MTKPELVKLMEDLTNEVDTYLLNTGIHHDKIIQMFKDTMLGVKDVDELKFIWLIADLYFIFSNSLMFDVKTVVKCLEDIRARLVNA